MKMNLLEKTELWIENIILKNVDLNRIAAAVAETLELKTEKVLVVDVREKHITLDILEKELDPKKIFGKKNKLLSALAGIEGVQLSADTDFHSHGILGSIILDEWKVDPVLERVNKISQQITSRIKNRVIVFPTGFEVKRGMIKDTNTPLISNTLQAEGFSVTCGEILDDDSVFIAGKIRRAIDDGYGLIITTGGIGAEDKDKTVEGVLKVDPLAATPYLVKFEKGKGRHEKEGIRIAVGQVENTLIVSLPGPNDEVIISLPVLIEQIKKGTTKDELGNRIAQVLREKLHGKAQH